MKVIVYKPIITEKSMRQANLGLYTFLVGQSASKVEIANFVSKTFSVDVLKVKTMNGKDQTKLQRTRKGFFTKSGLRKAMVKIKSGQKIGMFEDAAPKEEVEVVTAEGEHLTTVKEKTSLLRKTKVKIEQVTKKEVKK